MVLARKGAAVFGPNVVSALSFSSTTTHTCLIGGVSACAGPAVKANRAAPSAAQRAISRTGATPTGGKVEHKTGAVRRFGYRLVNLDGPIDRHQGRTDNGPEAGAS